MEKVRQIKILKESFPTNSNFMNFIHSLLTQLPFKSIEIFPDEVETEGVILYQQETLESEELWTCCITRTGDISGSVNVSTINKTENIILSLEHLLAKQFVIDKNTIIKADRFLIVTNGNISQNAQEAIKKKYKDAVIIFWDINKLQLVTAKNWIEFFESKEPQIQEYCANLKSKLEDISKELYILYYNKAAKKLWDIFVNLQLIESKVETTNVTIGSNLQERVNKNEPSYHEDNVIYIKNIIKEKFKIEDILDVGKNVIIIGDIGSGKSTILKRIAQEIMDKMCQGDNYKIPVFLNMRDLDKFDFDLFKYMQSEFISLTKGKKVDLVNYLKNNRIVLLLDGLDEKIDSNKELVLKSLSTFKDNYSNIQIIVTSRPVFILDKEPVFEAFRRFEILPLNYSQITELLDRWYPTDYKNKNKLINALKRTSLIVSIPKTPLAITLLAIIFEDEDKIDEIPANITELYNKFTDVFTGRWDIERGIAFQDKFGIRTHLINQIAFHMHFNKQLELSSDEMEQFILEYKTSKRYDDITKEDLLSELLDRNPLLTKLNNTYKFIHSSFQEFYASRGLEQTNIHVKDINKHLVSSFLDPWWSNVILFHVGSKKDCPELLIELAKNSVPSNMDERYIKIDSLGKLIQAAISTDNEPKVVCLDKALKTIDNFRNDIINLLQEIEEVNIQFRRKGLSGLYIISFLKDLFLTCYKSKYMKPVMTDIFEKKQVNQLSDLSFYILANALTELTQNPEYLLEFTNKPDIALEWKFFALCDIEKYNLKLDKEQKKVVNRVKSKVKKGRKYLLSTFKKLKSIPKLRERLEKEPELLQ